jgi:hypothetical protein
MVLKESQNLVIEQIRRRHKDLGRIDLGKRYRGVGVTNGLLINSAHFF